MNGQKFQYEERFLNRTDDSNGNKQDYHPATKKRAIIRRKVKTFLKTSTDVISNEKLRFEKLDNLHSEAGASGKLHFEGSQRFRLKHEGHGASPLRFESDRKKHDAADSSDGSNTVESRYGKYESPIDYSAASPSKRSKLWGKNKARSILGRSADAAVDNIAYQSENEGAQGANVERKAIWRGMKDGSRAGHRWSKGHAARIEKRELHAKNKELIRESKETLYQTQHGKLSARELKRKKRILKKQRMKAAAEKKLGEKTVSILEKIISTAAKLAGAAIRVAVAYIGAPLLGVFLVFGLLFLIAFLFAGTIVDTTIVIIASYSAEPSAIEQASAYYTQLEAEMEKKILDAPTSWEWGHIDEFRYDLDPIGHDPYQIMAYLNVKHPGFTLTPQSPEDSSFEEVKTEIDYIFDKRYDLIFDEEIEVRSYTVDYDDPDGTSGSYTVYYNYYILNIILRSKEQEPVLLEELAKNPKEELTEWYEVLQQSQGARQDYANPLPFDWRESVSSLYGYRIDPIGGRELQMHRGLDIAAPRGTPIVAGISGRVRYTGFDSIMGNYIILTDENDKTIKYGHCDSIEVETGVEVKAGETIIGTVGNTGQSTGAHLHVEIMELGDYLDPVYSLNFAA